MSYIIQTRHLINGEIQTDYFETLHVGTGKGVINKIVLHYTGKKKRALKFYDIEEAKRVSGLQTHIIETNILPYKKLKQ